MDLIILTFLIINIPEIFIWILPDSKNIIYKKYFLSYPKNFLYTSSIFIAIFIFLVFFIAYKPIMLNFIILSIYTFIFCGIYSELYILNIFNFNSRKKFLVRFNFINYILKNNKKMTLLLDENIFIINGEKIKNKYIKFNKTDKVKAIELFYKENINYVNIKFSDDKKSVEFIYK